MPPKSKITREIILEAAYAIAREQGAFTNLLSAIFGEVTHDLEQTVSALLLMIVTGCYALWVWKKAEDLKM